MGLMQFKDAKCSGLKPDADFTMSDTDFTMSDTEERPIRRAKLSLRFSTQSSTPSTWVWADPARRSNA